MTKRRTACDKDRTRWRSLRLEILEERQVLSAASVVEAEPLAIAAPWQNPTYPLDVNGDGTVLTTDMLTVINRLLTEGMGALPTPTEPVKTFYDTDGNNRLNSSDLLLIINALLTPPKASVSTLTPFTIDVTPKVTVNVTEGVANSLPDGTVVYLDVDLNNDGDFNDPGEFAHTQSTIYQGESNFVLSSGLPRSTELYTVRLQTRVKDNRAVSATSAAIPLVVDTLTSDALATYVNTPDNSYDWEIRNGNGNGEQRSVPGLGSYTYLAIDMTSQTWRSTADVDRPVWRHWLTIYLPNSPVVLTNSAVLLIDGGSNSNFSTVPASIDFLGQASLLLKSAFVQLKVVPNEPVIFTDETRTRSEDAIIAYSFDKFLENIGEPGNDTWPVLVAMVKSAVRAMDTVQAVVPTIRPSAVINDFIVTGYSKRGWTTWLTAAVDPRVRAILPGVFDNLNQAPQMAHHFGAYGFFSEAVHDYNEMEIFHRFLTPEALYLSRIVDPYSYLANGRFDNMPKLVINSAGDEFFVSDSAQFYFDDIPGESNYLIYLPNTGHGLDYDLGAGADPQQSKVATATVTFVDAILNNRTLPKYSWTVAQNGAIRVETDTQPIEVRLWQVTNPATRDFRRYLYPNLTWTSTILTPGADGAYVGNVPMPASGATGYFVELTFPNSNSSPIPLLANPYVFTTEIRVKSPLPMHPWPYTTAFDTTGAALSNFAVLGTAVPQNAVDPLLNATVSALALNSHAPASDTLGPQAVPFVGPLPDRVVERVVELDPAVLETLLAPELTPQLALTLQLAVAEAAELELDELLPELFA